MAETITVFSRKMLRCRVRAAIIRILAGLLKSVEVSMVL
jgi:hypothetical protein